MNPAAYLEMAETESAHWWFVGRRAILSTIIEDLRLPESPEILEIGCGTGGNLEMLAGFGEVRALEMDAGARAIAARKTHNCYDIRAGHFPDRVALDEQRFDLICILDVLEHVEQDTEALSAAGELLRPDGRILITVPAYRWLWSAHDELLHHKRRYSSSELRHKIALAGLRPVKISYFNTLLFPLAVIARFKDRVLSTASVTGTSIPPIPMNNLLETVFAAERFVLRHFNFPFGLSLLCVLERDGRAVSMPV